MSPDPILPGRAKAPTAAAMPHLKGCSLRRGRTVHDQKKTRRKGWRRFAGQGLFHIISTETLQQTPRRAVGRAASRHPPPLTAVTSGSPAPCHFAAESPQARGEGDPLPPWKPSRVSWDLPRCLCPGRGYLAGEAKNQAGKYAPAAASSAGRQRARADGGEGERRSGELRGARCIGARLGGGGKDEGQETANSAEPPSGSRHAGRKRRKGGRREKGQRRRRRSPGSPSRRRGSSAALPRTPAPPSTHPAGTPRHRAKGGSGSKSCEGAASAPYTTTTQVHVSAEGCMHADGGTGRPPASRLPSLRRHRGDPWRWEGKRLRCTPAPEGAERRDVRP